jgi:acyl-CoA synthetase (AMP-forming)/AMP-acid ligase II
LKQCIHELGAKKVGTSFGMTEGSPLRSTPVSDPSSLIQNGSVTVGTPLPGVGVRICTLGSMVPVLRGKYGELHQSGMQVIKSYIGRDGEEEFYEEGGRRWFRTGDQAVMWEDGRVGIVGRYKDMIIRGGENISPLGIERVLNGIEGVDVCFPINIVEEKHTR